MGDPASPSVEPQLDYVKSPINVPPMRDVDEMRDVDDL